MTFGLTDTGFVKKTLADIQTNVEQKQLDLISTELDQTPDSPLGQMNGILFGEFAELWDALAAVNASSDPDQATNAGQDAVCAITGTTRDAATKSKATCNVNLNAGITLTAGAAKASVQGNPAAIFALSANVTNPGGAPATVPAIFEAVDTGPVVANAGTLTVITTPISGWNSITNPQDAVRGANVESNEDLRVKREDELASEGSAPVDAIRADMLRVPGVLQCTVFENTLDVTDGNGLPPHSIEVLVFDGAVPGVLNNTIAQRIWDSKGGGIKTYGSSSGTAVDDLGVSQTVNFSRPTQLPVYFVIDIKVSSSFPGSGDTTAKTNLVTRGLQNQVGDDAVLASFYPALFAVTGVTDVPTFRAGFAPAPVGTSNLVVGTRELATFDASRITINHV